ncbi:hypothetical protein [Xanthomarina gelatinilytica]|uniref:hypothetical protein n=1 Tax=Xanthomarina gelatinilytica TaxID=1137281 RepID=UPI003AA7B792
MGCLTDELSADIAIDCDNLAIAGIEEDILLIPHDQRDTVATTFDPTNPNIMTALVLKAGSTGYLLEGVKQINGFNSEFVKGDSQTLNKHRHGIRGRILSPSAANRNQYDKLAAGKPYVAVVNKKYKGADSEDAFLVLGWESGIYLQTGTESSYENSGAIVLEMKSDDDQLENKSPKTLLETDYDTTLTAFNNKFAVAEA